MLWRGFQNRNDWRAMPLRSPINTGCSGRSRSSADSAPPSQRAAARAAQFDRRPAVTRSRSKACSTSSSRFPAWSKTRPTSSSTEASPVQACRRRPKASICARPAGVVTAPPSKPMAMSRFSTRDLHRNRKRRRQARHGNAPQTRRGYVSATAISRTTSASGSFPSIPCTPRRKCNYTVEPARLGQITITTN